MSSSSLSLSLAAARVALVGCDLRLARARVRVVAVSLLAGDRAAAVARSATAARDLRVVYARLRREGASPARLAVVARFGSFFAGVCDGAPVTGFPGASGRAVFDSVLSDIAGH